MDARYRILFVDDEPRVLDGLRRMLRRHSDAWAMSFAGSGDEALTALAASGFDVVVSDLRMPGMDGLDLFERVRERYPGVMRVLLSGQAPATRCDDALLVAHQFLAKPCEPARLRTTIERAAALRTLTDDPALPPIIGRIRHLLTVPSTHWSLTRLLEDERAGRREVAELITRDPGLAARVVALANSAYFGVARPASDVDTAIRYLGTEIVRGLVLAAQLYARGRRPDATALAALERRATATATLARSLATAEQRDLAFTAGLLTGVGELVRLDLDPTPPDFPTAAAAAYLLGTWGVPPELVLAVAAHATPATVRHDDPGLVAVVHVAAALATAGGGEPAIDRAWIERAGHRADLDRWLVVARGAT